VQAPARVVASACLAIHGILVPVTCERDRTDDSILTVPESRHPARACMTLEQHYDSLPLGSRVTIASTDLRLKRLLDDLGFNIERLDQQWCVMRRDTWRLRPVLRLVR
jgi:hypothetical protein